MRFRRLLLAIVLLVPAIAVWQPVRAADEAKILSKDLVVGGGAEAVRHSSVTVHYTGWLRDGTKFDSSLDHGKPFEFTLGSGDVIPGWDQGVAGMRVGGKRELIIPPQLAYGASGAGGVIPPNATLRFEIELLAVATPKYANVDNAELKKLLARGVKIVDVRTAPEWKETGLVAGSQKLTAFDEKGRFVQVFLDQFGQLAGKDDEVILICRTGSRSSVIARFLSERMNYSKVYNVQDGIARWIKDGNPVVR